MSFTKKMLLIVGFLASTAAFSAPTEADFQAAKGRHIANIQARLQSVQKLLSCVQAAQDKAAIKACHETAKAEHKALADKMKAEHEERKAQRETKKQVPSVTPATKK